jgi:two-component system, response regulator YesN
MPRQDQAGRTEIEFGFSDTRIDMAIKLIEQHYADADLKMDKLAKQVGLSYFYLSYLFKKCTGIRSKEYLRMVRITKAEQLLKSTMLNVNEIAFAVGYNHASNFHHDFKASLGISPGEYRSHWHIFNF